MKKGILSVGEVFPEFKKTSVVSLEKGCEFFEITSEELWRNNDQWTVMFWWPKDLSFICPTELAEFNRRFSDFQANNAKLIGASTDSEFIHLAWRKNHPDLHDLRFPMMADTSKSLAYELGILETQDQVAYRATFIIDPKRIVRWVSVYDMNVGRNVSEVIRVLEALKTGKQCPCNWEKSKC